VGLWHIYALSGISDPERTALGWASDWISSTRRDLLQECRRHKASTPRSTRISSVCTMKFGQALRTRHRLLRLKSSGFHQLSKSRMASTKELCREDLQRVRRMQHHHHLTINSKVRGGPVAFKDTNPSGIQVTPVQQCHHK
jgi:hypothetical protein